MIGGIIGDIIGSIYEDGLIKSKTFPLWDANCHFTDDTVLTVATADWLINGGKCEDYYYSYALNYPACGYGTGFLKWVFMRKYRNKYLPYNSFGNGSAMRVGPVGWYCENIEDVMRISKESATCTHNHEEGIRGAQAIACCVFLAKKKIAKKEMKRIIENRFNYNISLSLHEASKDYIWNATCQNTVPQAIISFLESVDFEDSIRNAISLGGDSDTIACMTGAISEAYYGIPVVIRKRALDYIPKTMINIIKMFESCYGSG